MRGPQVNSCRPAAVGWRPGPSHCQSGPSLSCVDGLLLLGVGLLGLVTGLAAALAFRVSERERLAEPPAEPELDEGATAVLNVLHSAAVVARSDGTPIRASAAAQALGLVRDDRVAHRAVRELIGQVARTGEIVDTEFVLPRGPLGGQTVALQMRVAPLGLRHVLVLFDDRTETRRVEAIRRDFAVNVSHELKTPVGAISLLSEALDAAADDPQAVREFSAQIGTEAVRLAALVQDIIEISRLQTVDPLRNVARVALDDVVAEAVSRAATLATRKGVRIQVGPASDAAVWGDRDLLVHAVRNLVDNAVTYSDPGHAVAVVVTPRAPEGLVDVVVVDQGIGIPAEAQARLFERFFRVDPARSRETGGTGLGLAIVKHVATGHGGDVTVWSEPGQGSTFTIRLPWSPRLPAEDTSPEGADR